MNCKDCRYFGAESGKKYGRVPQHICECKESIFKTCARTASGCDKFERKEIPIQTSGISSYYSADSYVFDDKEE